MTTEAKIIIAKLMIGMINEYIPEDQRVVDFSDGKVDLNSVLEMLTDKVNAYENSNEKKFLDIAKSYFTKLGQEKFMYDFICELNEAGIDTSKLDSVNPSYMVGLQTRDTNYMIAINTPNGNIITHRTLRDSPGVWTPGLPQGEDLVLTDDTTKSVFDSNDNLIIGQ